MKLKFVLIPLIIISLFGCSSKEAKNKEAKSLSESINLDVHEIKLDNGMTALIYPNNRLPIFSVYLYYKVGGKNERPGITGASHFLEHMMFKGAKKYGQGKIDFLIEGSGGSTNAYTTNDQTVYYENLPTTELETILDIESDRLENLLLDKEAFEKERAVVLEERKMRYENSPRGQLYLGLMKNLYKGTPYGSSVIGEIPDLKSVSREQIHEYFKQFYAPNNLTLVLVGDVDKKKAESIIREKFGSIPASPKVEEAHKSLKDEDFVPNLKSDKTVALKGESPNPIFMMGYPTVKAGHPQQYALDVLSSILGAGKSSFLVKEFILIKKPVATSLYSAHNSLEKSGFFFIGGELVKGVKLKNFEKNLVAKLKNACETEVTEKSIQKVKNNYLVDLYSSLDSNAGLAQFLGERELLYGDWRKYKEELKMYEKVDVETVKKECRDVFSSPHLFISVWNQHPSK